MVRDPLGKSRVALTLDHVGRDEGILLRTIEIADIELPSCLGRELCGLEENTIVRVESSDLTISEDEVLQTKEAIIGLVATDTSIETLFFEVVKDKGLEEGRLVEVKIGGLPVTYQLVNGLTKEEIVQQKNTHGIVRAQAQKIGHWDIERKRFQPAKWLPKPNSPVFLKHAKEFQPCTSAVGHFPGTDYPVVIKSISDLVTPNTTILGILGVGKSMLDIELVERMLAEGVKVICIDLTNQYADELAPYFNAATEQEIIENLQQIGQDGRTRVHQNVEHGGSRQAFSAALAADIATFVHPNTHSCIKIYNPSQFEVWRQDSRPFNSTASMASLSPAEITHIISDSTLAAVSALGMTRPG